MKWIFPERGQGDIERKPHDREFFVQEKEHHAALIREAIQNSLDAGLYGEESVKIIFSFNLVEKAKCDKYFCNLGNHLHACYDLRGKNLLQNNDRIPCLIIEDFNTVGLDGEYEREKDGDSNFLNFWWGEGISGKEGKRGGRWGLGKAIFHSASRIGSFFGLTVRRDGKKLLLGKAVLIPHTFDGNRYKYHGHFVADSSYRPVMDKDSIDEFSNVFDLARNEQSGLSLVIPFYPEGYSKENLIEAIITEYFFPVIRKKLECVVEEKWDTESREIIKADTLVDLARSQNWQDTEWEAQEIDALMKFIMDAETKPDREWIQLKESDNQQKITEELFGDDLEKIREDYENEELLMIKIPVIIIEKGGYKFRSYFEVFLRKDSRLKKGDEYYIRSGILIPRISKIKSRRIRAILYADHEPVSKFLGDSETPAHTDWNENSEGFKEKYEKPAWTLRYIKNSIRNIVDILERPPEGEVKDFLKDIFYVEGDEMESLTPETAGVEDNPAGVNDSVPEITGEMQHFKVRRIENGICITGEVEEDPTSAKLLIRIAYDVKRGNPFTRYQPFDFDLKDDKQIEKTVKGAKLLKYDRNLIELQIKENVFEIELTGFDKKRDIVVDVRREQSEEAS